MPVDRCHLVAVLDHVLVHGTVALFRVAVRVHVVSVGATVVVVGDDRARCAFYVLRSYLILPLLDVVSYGATQLTVIQATVPAYLHLSEKIFSSLSSYCYSDKCLREILGCHRIISSLNLEKESRESRYSANGFVSDDGRFMLTLHLM